MHNDISKWNARSTYLSAIAPLTMVVAVVANDNWNRNAAKIGPIKGSPAILWTTIKWYECGIQSIQWIENAKGLYQLKDRNGLLLLSPGGSEIFKKEQSMRMALVCENIHSRIRIKTNENHCALFCSFKYLVKSLRWQWRDLLVAPVRMTCHSQRANK